MIVQHNTEGANNKHAPGKRQSNRSKHHSLRQLSDEKYVNLRYFHEIGVARISNDYSSNCWASPPALTLRKLKPTKDLRIL